VSLSPVAAIEAARGTRGRPREQAICDAALALLLEVGYDRLTMDAVAAKAHASKATIYRRWSGKRELVLDAVRARHEECPPPPDTGTLRGDLIGAFRLLTDRIGADDMTLMAGVLREMQACPDLAACMRSQVFEEKLALTTVILERAVARGEVGPDADPALLHEVASAQMIFRLLVVGAPADDDYLAHVVDDVLVPLMTRTGRPTS
jgi:AcrR family transcriptional regulator